MRDFVRVLSVCAAVQGATACADHRGPTNLDFEQRVFNAIGGLQVGESFTLEGDAASDIHFTGSSRVAEFIVIPFHASTDGSAFLNLTVSATDLGQPPLFDVVSGMPMAEPVDDGGDLHAELYSRMQAATAPLLRRPRTVAAAPTGSRLETSNDLSGGNSFVGQLVSLNANAGGSACDVLVPRPGRVEAIGRHSIIVSDLANPSGGFSREDYQSFGQEFDDLIYPTLSRYFPAPTDIDENGRVIIFFTRAVNELTPPGSTGFVAGFFWSRDLFPIGDCLASNHGEVFFALVPDPNREASTLAHTRDNVFNSALATIGHEFQHLVNAGRRIYVNEAEWEEVWLDEALSHMAEELLFYAESGLSPESNVSSGILTPELSASINRFMRQNLTRYGFYLQAVKRESLLRPEAGLETRGAAWSFLRYVADHLPLSDEELLTRLVDSQSRGVENLEQAIDGNALEWIRRWGVSIYTDDRLGRDPLFQQPSWHARSLVPLLFGGRFPLRVDGLSPSTALNLDLRGGTSGYFRIRTIPRLTGTLSIRADGPLPNELKVTVLRIQ